MSVREQLYRNLPRRIRHVRATKYAEGLAQGNPGCIASEWATAQTRKQMDLEIKQLIRDFPHVEQTARKLLRETLEGMTHG